MSTSKTGKHGHAKANFVAVDIFTEKKYEDIVPTSHNAEVPNVTRAEYTVLNIEDEAVSLMDDNGETKDDLDLPKPEGKAAEVRDKILKMWEEGTESIVTVVSAMGIEQILDARPAKQ